MIKKKLRKSAKNHLRNCYVRQDGRIFPFGIIRILNKSVSDDLRDDSSGLECFSEKLIPYGDGNHYAKMGSNNLLIFNKQSEKKVYEISFYAIFTVKIQTVKVMTMGYLKTTGVIGGFFNNNHFEGLDLDSSLELAAKGKDPKSYDNSTFVSVANKLIGQDLIQVSFFGGKEDDYLILTKDGKLVSHKTSKPLAYTKWGAKMPKEIFAY